MLDDARKDAPFEKGGKLESADDKLGDKKQ
jgi:hypothetical protein